MEVPMNLVTIIGNWRSNREAARELAALGTEERQTLARDLGLSADKLVELSEHGVASGEELRRFMRALGLAPERIRRTHVGVMHDMGVVCAGCLAASRCRRDLDRGWVPVVQRYCPNAQTLNALLAEKWQMGLPQVHRSL
jgi:uncharacterized protein YjiS (DUF1127 family)